MQQVLYLSGTLSSRIEKNKIIMSKLKKVLVEMKKYKLSNLYILFTVKCMNIFLNYLILSAVISFSVESLSILVPHHVKIETVPKRRRGLQKC